MDRLARIDRVLHDVHDILHRFVTEDGEPPPAAPRIAVPTVKGGRDLVRVSWPGLGAFWLNKPQSRVVDELLEAQMTCKTPDVDQRHLLTVSKSRAARLPEVFDGSRAWGTLVLPGSRPGTYRLAPLPEPPDDAA